MRVLHCPTDTGGNAWGLSRAERKLGVHSNVMVRRADVRQYPHDIDLRLRSGWWPSRLYRLTKFLVVAARDYDVFHFNWGMTIFDSRLWNVNCLELPLLKRLGKRIVVTFQGCDARMKMWSRDHLATSACRECDVAWCTEQVDQIRRKRIKKIFLYADQVFALNPDLLHFLPGAEFLPYASVDPGEWVPSRRSVDWKDRTQPLKILHLPTNRSIKGTRYVESACDRLRREGIAVELSVVENAPHARMKELIGAADVVVDQLLIGWYGAVAVEAMALEKPVFCYLREEDLKRFVPFHEQIPIIRTTKETLADDLRSFLMRRTEGRDIGAAGRAFVRRYHDPLEIARRTILAYEKDVSRS